MNAEKLTRILLVDDQRDIRSIVGLALGKIGGFQVKVCESGEEALASAGDFAPDLLLLDLSMPVLDGVGTLKALRARGLTAPAVFFTARLNAKDAEGYRDLGVLGVIPKPFDPLKLGSQLREMWSKR
ncbi:MAG TPA: response regulator [Usitatibacter sp.]|jgi:CheY-like chemotaxis protein|nr:response regulator [Usitatibacter sp.]